MADDIEVTFIDASNDTPFDQLKVPASQLPETFEHTTSLHLGELEWSVESATPMTRAEYTQTKTLVLRLRKIVRVDPKTILFSLSTIESAIPSSDAANAANATSGDPSTSEDLELHEDDWRQLEFVSRAYEDAIDEELDAIGDIHVNHRAGIGFKKLHARSRIPHPIVPNALRLSDLGEVSARGLTFRGTGRRIPNGFVVELGSSTALYGIAKDGDVGVLCLRVEGAVEDDVLKTLERLQKDHALIFVDWCSCRTGMRAFFND